MNTKYELNETALKINNLLSKYIIIHDEVFKFSWRKIIPLPFIFKTMNFLDLHEKANEIMNNLKQCNDAVNRILSEASDQESRFAYFLSEYCLSLINTVSRLKGMLYQLYLKSENSGDYNLLKHNSLSAEYKKAVREYQNMGARLNKLHTEFSK